MEKEYIFTENPEEEMWQTLLQFSYAANIERYLSEHGYDTTDDLIENISGSILQAYEYFNASTHANLQIKPLLLYYGTTNLLNGICNLLSGNINTIKSHGMQKIPPAKGECIGDTEIVFEKPTNGGVHVFARCMDMSIDLCQHGKWTVREMLSSIPELQSDFKKCYGENYSNTLMLYEYNTPDGKLEKIHIDGLDVDKIFESLKKVEGFSTNYLSPVVTPNTCDLILRHKLSGKDIAGISYSGQPYLQIGHTKQGKLITLPQFFYMYITLFALGSLCRYNPEIWNPFVKQDNTGEKLLVEKYLYYARRLIPNYVINHIFGKMIIYTNDKYAPIDTVKVVGEHEIQELVAKEIQKQEERKGVRRVFER